VSYRPQKPSEWAEQALLQANSKPIKAIAEMELLRGVELRPGHNQINLFPLLNCEAALACSRRQGNRWRIILPGLQKRERAFCQMRSPERISKGILL
jgi:hypothetical protein